MIVLFLPSPQLRTHFSHVFTFLILAVNIVIYLQLTTISKLVLRMPVILYTVM